MLNLEQKLENRTAIIGIIGLGYVGLPSAIAFSEASFTVLGVNIQHRRVDLINKGQSYITDIESAERNTICRKTKGA